MDPLEEQEQEIEVLQSIYPDEIEVYSKTHFSIRLELETPSDRKHALLLIVRYPEQYPEVVPTLDVHVCESVNEEEEDEDEDEDEDENKFVSLAESIEFEKADLNVLLGKMKEEAEMNIGFPSVFGLAALLRDEGEALFQQKLDVAQKKYDDELLAKEAEEQKKFHGTKVTKESFNAWRDKFRTEMQIELKDKERVESMHNGKMSGREIFERGLAGNEDDLVELAESVAKVEV